MPDQFEVFPIPSLFLPGTVALPSPFPTVGKVWLPSPDCEHLPGILQGISLVAIGNSVPPFTSIVRYVRAEQISAIFLQHDTGGTEQSTLVDWKQGEWLYAPSLDRLKHGLTATSRGIVYVPENAPVMTQAIFGATAGESAEYMGYLVGRCDH